MGKVRGMHENRNACSDFMASTEGKRHLGTPGVVGRMILEWNLKTWDG
jgi:hypothetical protein